MMCVQCILQCSRAYTFKQLCEKSDNTLRQYTSPEFQSQLPKEEIPKPAKIISEEKVLEEIDFTDNATNVFVQIADDMDAPNQYVEYATPVQSNGKQLFTIKLEEPLVLAPQKESPEKPNKYPCYICNASFPLRVDLKVHMMTHPRETNYQCEVCEKAFAEPRILKRHMKTHLEVKPHKCDKCNMSFAESSNLSKHKKKHTGELRNIKGKPHLCSVCGRAFKWASSLSKHMKYHTGHKLLTCKHCGRKYVEARSLRIHMRSHTGERPYVCTICQKGFTQICNLEKHVRVHTGEKPYLCNICGKG